jgi:hypothetical protein
VYRLITIATTMVHNQFSSSVSRLEGVGRPVAKFTREILAKERGGLLSHVRDNREKHLSG